MTAPIRQFRLAVHLIRDGAPELKYSRLLDMPKDPYDLPDFIRDAGQSIENTLHQAVTGELFQ